MGLDLSDERVRDALVEMQRRQVKGESIEDVMKNMESSYKSSSSRGGGKRKSYMHIILPVMLAVFLYRMYSLGLLNWILGYVLGDSELGKGDDDFFI